MQYEFNTYTTSDGELEVSFLFLEIDKDEWQAYILTDINYQRYDEERDDSLNCIHRLGEYDSDIKDNVFNFIRENNILYTNPKLYYICWTEDITSLENMKEVAKAWCELTALYVKYGTEFSVNHPKLKERGIISF
ncbi:MAG: hypothetical protein IJT44_08005 [Clostridia bacterium]|nr:hypothetical protein [Clostridia bacterium]